MNGGMFSGLRLTGRSLVLLALVSCGSALAQENVARAVATTGMVADVVENVGGPCVTVEAIMQPGVDPHLYKAKPSDVRRFYYADIIFYSGYHLEGQLGEVLEAFSERKPVVALAERAVAPSETLRLPGENAYDPHLWMDVSLWARTADGVVEALSELNPSCRTGLKERAETYKQQLMALDGWIRASVASIPERQRVLVTAHDAFNYYSRAYGIAVESIQGISTQAEAGLADIRETVSLVVDRDVPALFVESSINPRTVQAVLQAVRSRGVIVNIGGELFSDAFGASGTAEGTYIGMLYHNTLTITEALGGTPPALPRALQPWSDQWNLAGKL